MALEIKKSILEAGVSQVGLFELKGEINSVTAGSLGEAFNQTADEGIIKLIVVLDSVEFLSTAGLREFVSALRRVTRSLDKTNTPGDIRLAQLNEVSRKFIELSCLDEIINIFPTLEDALKSYYLVKARETTPPTQ